MISNKVFYLLFMLSVALSLDISAQPVSGTWATLSLVTFDRQFNEDFGMEIEVPRVSPAVRALEGKEIEVNGYIIPLDGKREQSHVMLSAFPQSTCFFCGKAGPESAMQAFMKGGKKLRYTDEKVTLKGILRVNEKDITSLLYTMEDAVLVKNR
jgi:hypothetical protein